MTAEEMVRRAGELHDKVHEAAALVDYHTHVEIGWAPEEAIPILADALQEMYSLARAETAKEVIEAAALACDEIFDLHQRDGCECSAGEDCAEAIRTMASRYAETPAKEK